MEKVRLTLLIPLLILVFISPVQLVGQPVANRGIIDLRNYDFEESGPIELNGEWKFYWQQFITPENALNAVPELVDFPHIWSLDPNYDTFGYGTYSVTILLPENKNDLALTIPDMYTAYRLVVNGEEFASNGEVSNTERSAVPKWMPQTVPLDLDETDRLVLILQISNYSHSKSGIRLPIIFGPFDKLSTQREIEIGYAFVLTGSLIMGAFFFLALYFFGNKDTATLTFALFCLAYSYRTIGTELYPLHILLPDIPWLITVKLEYISLYFSALLFGIFLQNLYPKESNKIIEKTFTWVLGIFTVSAALLPAYYFTLLINTFFGILTVYITYSIYVVVRAWRNKRVGSEYSLIGFFVIFVVFIYDLLEYFVLLDENLFINFIGYLAFFFLQSLTLTNRFSFALNQAREKAEAASVAKTHFLSTMGHELRTPLNAVIGFSELLLDSKSENEKTQFTQIIKKSGENLLGIINNILDFTKIESEELVLEYKATNIPNMMADTLKMLGSLTDNEKVKLSFRFEDSLSDYIITDPVRLRQIIINIVGNAIKFTDEGEISIQITTTSSIAEKGQILFIIKDTGIGIPEEKMAQLFERFTQLDTDHNRKYGGTGLGLAISKKLIEGLGGRIWVQSTYGKGTTFYFTIKAEFTDAPEVVEDVDSLHLKSVPKTLKILVVEDNLISQKVVAKVLERLGFTSDLAINGFEAVEMCNDSFYDLIFMDMDMPEMDGLETTRIILKDANPSEKPTIIAMTANATLEDKAACFKAGMVDFVSKPISIASTRNAIVKWFSGSRL